MSELSPNITPETWTFLRSRIDKIGHKCGAFDPYTDKRACLICNYGVADAWIHLDVSKSYRVPWDYPKHLIRCI